jgi:hypothetical protein
MEPPAADRDLLSRNPARFIVDHDPVLLILVQYLRKTEPALTKFEKLLLSLSLIGFLVIGIFVSVKIGGGSNLHNMDLFLVTLLLIIHIFWERGAADWFMQEVQCGKKVTYVVLFLLLYQCFIHLDSVKPLALPDDGTVNEALASIQAAVDEKKKLEQSSSSIRGNCSPSVRSKMFPCMENMKETDDERSHER